MKTLHHLIAAFLFLFGWVCAGNSEPEGRIESLSAGELQSLLGIRSWKVSLPENVDAIWRFDFERLIDGKRKLILGGGERTPESGELSVALRETDEEVQLTVIMDTHVHPVTIPKKHLVERDPKFAWFSRALISPKKVDGKLVLYEEKIFRVPFLDKNGSYDSTDPRAEHVATSVISISKRELGEQDGARQPATAADSKSAGKKAPKPESKGRSH